MSPFLLIGICTLRFIIANILHVIPHHLNSFLNKQFCAFLPSGKTWSPSANPLPRSNTFLPNKVLFVSKPTGSRRGTGVATPGRAPYPATLGGEKIPPPVTSSRANGHQMAPRVPLALLRWVTARTRLSGNVLSKSTVFGLI